MRKDITLRTMRPEDAPAVGAVYRHYVENSTATFDWEAPAPEAYMDHILRPEYPALVAEASGRVIGYAYAAPFRTRRAYDWTCESTIYLSPEVCRAGVGTRLYRALLELLRLQGIHTVCACITQENTESVAFHARLGFKTCAHFKDCGVKFGRPVSMIWMDRTLTALSSTPPLSFAALDSAGVQKILEKS